MEFKSALIIGKFMPVHAGHLAMVEFATRRATTTHVLLGALAGEPIPGPLRFKWLEESLAAYPSAVAHYTDEDLPAAAESSRDVSRVWAAWLKAKFPEADLIVSSEPYGDYLAEYMGIAHLSFDPGRSGLPVSATMIREAPWLHWESIPLPARPYFVKTVCVYGPESTGKTTISERIAGMLDTEWVPEMARLYIGDRKPRKEDIDVVAALHAKEIAAKRPLADRILIVDSDLVTTRIYAEVLFGYEPAFPPWIEEANRFDLHLLFDVDAPWVDDVQRESGHVRAEMFARFRRELELRSLPYEIVRGTWEEREEACLSAIERRWPGMVVRPCRKGAGEA